MCPHAAPELPVSIPGDMGTLTTFLSVARVEAISPGFSWRTAKAALWHSEPHLVRADRGSFQILVATRSESASLSPPGVFFPLYLMFSLLRRCYNLKTWNIQSALLVPKLFLTQSDP